MGTLCVAPIVEGHGEYEAVRILIQRVWRELLGGEHAHVLRPIRWPRTKLLQPSELKRAIDLAVLKLETSCSGDPGMVLVLIDADLRPPCELGPKLLQQARSGRPDANIACVVANVEYETWFVAAASSLPGFLRLEGEVPEDPEARRLGKGWIQHRFLGIKYSETLDQPAMTASMDLHQCRQRSPSFDKFCRELALRMV